MVLPLSLYPLALYFLTFTTRRKYFSAFCHLTKFHERKELLCLLYHQHPVQSLVFDIQKLGRYLLDIYWIDG